MCTKFVAFCSVPFSAPGVEDCPLLLIRKENDRRPVDIEPEVGVRVARKETEAVNGHGRIPPAIR